MDEVIGFELQMKHYNGNIKIKCLLVMCMPISGQIMQTAKMRFVRAPLESTSPLPFRGMML